MRNRAILLLLARLGLRAVSDLKPAMIPIKIRPVSGSEDTPGSATLASSLPLSEKNSMPAKRLTMRQLRQMLRGLCPWQERREHDVDRERVESCEGGDKCDEFRTAGVPSWVVGHGEL